jgi:hypothetical protein
MLTQLSKTDDNPDPSGAPTMQCARCDAFAEETADFCTGCGAQLRLMEGDVDPIQVGTWTTTVSPAATDPEATEDATVPITGTTEQTSDTDSESDPSGQPVTELLLPEQPRRLVTNMGEREKAAWLDDVWGRPDDRADVGSAAY